MEKSKENEIYEHSLSEIKSENSGLINLSSCDASSLNDGSLIF